MLILIGWCGNPILFGEQVLFRINEVPKQLPGVSRDVADMYGMSYLIQE